MNTGMNIDIIKRKRLRYVSILWVNYHHQHFILIMELNTNRNIACIIFPFFLILLFFLTFKFILLIYILKGPQWK